jgi:hypothetical protein
MTISTEWTGRMLNGVRSLTGQEPLSVQDFVTNNMATFHRVCKRRLSVCGHIAPAWLREQPELLEERHVRSCASSTDRVRRKRHGFLQVSLSKILGNRHVPFTSTSSASDFR